MTLLIAAVFIVSLLIGVPIVFVIGLTVLVYMLVSGMPLELIPQRMFVGVDSFVLMAVPFFILAGNLMNAGGLTKRLIRFAYVLIGTVRGGLAYVNVVTSMVFAGITGAATADTSSVGSILIPAMKEEGYDLSFSAAVTAASSTIGGIIPPSLPFIIFAVTAGNVSVASLFLAGIIPGILIGFGQMVLIRIYYLEKCPIVANRKKIPVSEIPKEIRDAILALIMPIIMVGGILSGFFTPTEASAVSCVYAFIVTTFVYKELKLSQLPKVILNTAITTGSCYMIVAAAAPFGWLLSAEMIPQSLTAAMLSITDNPNIIIFLMLLLLLFVGTFMETIAAIIVITPVLLPLATKLGLNLIHFGLLECFAIYIGLTTPPVGICLYIACSISGVSLEKLTRSIIPFIMISIAILIIIAYFPSVFMYLPSRLM
jgi:C4-dicarboxylate transporter DctM subunit